MGINQDFKDLLHHLNKNGVEYLVIGAYAVTYYTEPRYTKDIDIWVNSTPGNAARVYRALKNFGAPVNSLTENDLQNKNLVYQIGVEPNRADILMGIKDMDFGKAWKGRRTTRYGKEKMYVIGMEDLITSKKIAGRPHDERDIEILKRAKKLLSGKKRK